MILILETLTLRYSLACSFSTIDLSSSVVTSWVISLPAYLLWSRGLTGLGWILLHWSGFTTIKYMAYGFAYPFYN